ncbi:hypothetical protein [Streptomyces sp. NBC_01800]|uniref:hypothetical protein n=1 Tax=Streptomyces sp. NBC_01800 TaxID=2975945 RepID=UPI002DDA6F72|nr:hypothetical protein [Streptomyces sp. NBC_01800]WSA73279.1 hypothetical protein OIE65_44320 [Streptomyces sp. NBC_01800]
MATVHVPVCVAANLNVEVICLRRRLLGLRPGHYASWAAIPFLRLLNLALQLRFFGC